MVSRRKKAILLGVILMLLLLGVVGIILYVKKKPGPVAQAGANPWKATRVSYHDPCDAACIKRLKPFVMLRGAHVGPLHLYLRPDVDDPVAQLGDCLQSVMKCVDRRGKSKPGKVIRPCVKASSCPPLCKRAFEKRAAALEDAEALLDALEAVFMKEGALCHPGQEGGKR